MLLSFPHGVPSARSPPVTRVHTRSLNLPAALLLRKDLLHGYRPSCLGTTYHLFQVLGAPAVCRGQRDKRGAVPSHLCPAPSSGGQCSGDSSVPRVPGGLQAKAGARCGRCAHVGPSPRIITLGCFIFSNLLNLSVPQFPSKMGSTAPILYNRLEDMAPLVNALALFPLGGRSRASIGAQGPPDTRDAARAMGPPSPWHRRGRGQAGGV